MLYVQSIRVQMLALGSVALVYSLVNSKLCVDCFFGPKSYAALGSLEVVRATHSYSSLEPTQ